MFLRPERKLPSHTHTCSKSDPRGWLTACCPESFCGKGLHWRGSRGQLETETSLAFPESTMGSFTLVELLAQPKGTLGREGNKGGSRSGASPAVENVPRRERCRVTV